MRVNRQVVDKLLRFFPHAVGSYFKPVDLSVVTNSSPPFVCGLMMMVNMRPSEVREICLSGPGKH
jgi:hypothetical protein